MRSTGNVIRPAIAIPICLVSACLIGAAVAVAVAAAKDKPLPAIEFGNERRDPAPSSEVPQTTDTLWIVDWSFGSGTCASSGWQASDLRILNDGSNYWHSGGGFDSQGGITGQAAILSMHNLCWASPDGYDNDWDYSIVCRYTGSGATLSFDYLLDVEEGYDSLTVEADEDCASNARVDYSIDPRATPSQFRQLLFADTGLNTSGRAGALALPDFGAPSDTHCVYLRFFSDFGYSPADGLYPTTLGAALVVDNIQVTGGLPYSEDFEGPVPVPWVSSVNSAPATPFGLWARLHPRVTDNDACAEPSGCAWLFTDPTLPAASPAMAFGPDGAVVRNWLDNAIVSPWVNMTPVPGLASLFVESRVFPGNNYSTGAILHNYSFRTKRWVDNTDTPDLGDSLECVSTWQKADKWYSLGLFEWRSRIDVLAPPPDFHALQVRYRVSDRQRIYGSPPPSPWDPGPGPYLDRLRIGQTIGPVFIGSNDYIAQDNFPSMDDPSSTGLHYVPTTDRFGTSDFQQPDQHVSGHRPPGGSWINTINTCDSLVVWVRDALNTGGITAVDFHGAIVSGPHSGKAPPPWMVGANGFFRVPCTPVPNRDGNWFVDLDDEYFRGGDVLLYFWSATDGLGNFATQPRGMNTLPASVAAADAATGGLLLVNYLPTIDWDPSYLARIAADPHGKLEPTTAEIEGSHQRTCFLYSYIGRPDRRSGPANRTSFMYTLDRLGYQDAYDVYFQMPGAIASNPLGTHATVEQATEYAVIILDPLGYDWYAIPDGSGLEHLVDMNAWYRAWFAQAPTSEAGRVALWLLGENVAEANIGMNNSLIANEMGVSLAAPSQGLAAIPEVRGQGNFTWSTGITTDFASDRFFLVDPHCSFVQKYDALGAVGTAVVTHRFAAGGSVGDGAVIMNADSASAWNTVVMSLAWGDIREPGGTPGSPASALAGAILGAVLPSNCQAQIDSATTVFWDDDTMLPKVTALHANVPNPFNPATTLRFDVGNTGHADLRIYDVSGRLVRTLLSQRLERRSYRWIWDGLDDNGRRVASGIYITRLHTADASLSRKLVVLR